MTVEQLKSAINKVREDLEQRYPIRLIGIFGSAARGDAGPDSDVDILAEPGPGLSLFKLGAVQMLLEDVVGRKVDLAFESALKPRIRARVMAELKPL